MLSEEASKVINCDAFFVMQSVTCVLAEVSICTCTVCLHLATVKQGRDIADDLRHTDAY